MPIIWKPNKGRQEFALANAKQVTLYGGARGGGKTEAGIAWMAYPQYLQHPLFRGLVLRYTFSDLHDWRERAMRLYAGLGATSSGEYIRFPSGAQIQMGHFRDQRSLEKYQGLEKHKILIEELTLIEKEKYFIQLLASARTTIPELEPLVFCTANPMGAGHAWVNSVFVEGKEKMKPFYSDRLEKVAIYIPATIDDNPKIPDSYVKNLEAIRHTDPEKYKAWRFGDWSVRADQFFTLFTDAPPPSGHVILPFEPKNTRKYTDGAPTQIQKSKQ